MKMRMYLVIFFSLLSGCQLRARPSTSVLVIGVESLGFDVVSCGADPYQSTDLPGFAMFCEESVRFTHAMSPSPLSQAAWSALLAVDYPFKTGVHTNGSDFLSAKVETIAEQAVHSYYRTGFFSGGPPLFRKSGLAQGFEVFDDHIAVHRSRPYRSARETFDRFLGWLNDEVESDPFFAAVHLADLQFPQVSTLNEVGEVRERSFSSQVRAVGEALSFLSTRLKKMRRWDSTTLVLVGMNGPGSNADLQRQSTQVALFFKPARREGREPIEWKIDRLVSLIDVGKTVQELLGVTRAVEKSDDDLRTLSLANLLQTPDVEWKGERYIIVESAWPKWRGVGTTRAALRIDPFLFMFDEKPKIFNTFVDRLEASPSPLSDPRTSERAKEFTSIVLSLGYEPYHDIRSDKVRKWTALAKGDFAELESLGASGAAAFLAVQRRDWAALNRLGQANSNLLWQFVASRNQGLKIRPKLTGCSSLFVSGTEASSVVDCTDRLFLTLLSWIHEKREGERRMLQERFLSGYLRELLQSRVNELNLSRHLAWDTSIETLYEPSLTELFLALPENKMYATIAKIRALKEDNALDLRPSIEF